MSKEIKLKCGGVAIVDDEDYERISQYKWYELYTEGHRYAGCTSPNASGYGRMHRMVLEISDERIVDHVDGDGWNNRKSNLRIATPSQNMANSKRPRDNTSGVKGVWQLPNDKWSAKICVNYKQIHLGVFDTRDAAAAAYIKAARRYYGEFANTGDDD
jgi:hypothetical protein